MIALSNRKSNKSASFLCRSPEIKYHHKRARHRLGTATSSGITCLLYVHVHLRPLSCAKNTDRRFSPVRSMIYAGRSMHVNGVGVGPRRRLRSRPSPVLQVHRGAGIVRLFATYEHTGSEFMIITNFAKIEALHQTSRRKEKSISFA